MSDLKQPAGSLNSSHNLSSFEAFWKWSKDISLPQRHKTEPQDSRPNKEPASNHAAKPKSSKERRAQVLNAQRKHRERKENYIKSLEHEVVRLRDFELAASRKMVALENDVALLSQTLQAAYIPLPDGLNAQVGNSNQLEYISAYSDANWHPQTEEGISNLHQGQDSTSSPKATQHNIGNGQPQISTHINTFCSNKNAVDFILRLENPCRDHLHPPSWQTWLSEPPNSDLSGHCLTASMLTALDASNLSLNSSSQYNSSSGPLSQESTSSPSSIPAATEIPYSEVDKLLFLSESLQLQGEVTPVQAWNRLRHDKRLSRLEEGAWHGIIEKLANMVKCYGFGAVIDDWAFEDILAGSVDAAQSSSR